MPTVFFTSTVLGDDSSVTLGSEVSAETVWATAGENLTAGKSVRLKQSVTGPVVELYDYVTVPDTTLLPFGIVMSSVSSGDACLIAIGGMIPSSITGLTTSADVDPVTVSSTGTLTRNPNYLASDWVIGIVDTQGRVQMFTPILGGVYAGYQALFP